METVVGGNRKSGRENSRIVTIILFVIAAVFLFGTLPAPAVVPDAASNDGFQPKLFKGHVQKTRTHLDLSKRNTLRGEKAEKKYKEDEILVKFKAGVSEDRSE